MALQQCNLWQHLELSMSDTFLQTSDVVLTQLQNSFQKMPPKNIS
jgi:hypothetical protein